jgi:KDO2-lipid IV(A) palmitoleoyltransferase
VLWLIVQLPYPVLHLIGTSAGRASRRFLKRREHIARRNLELCFPTMSPAAREKLIEQNFMSLGMGLIETGMAWFWSDERVKKWFDVEGMVNLNNALSEQKGVMVVGVHFMSLELGGRTMGLCRPMMATYRPHNSPLMEWVQTRGRLRSNKAMIDRRNLSGLVHALKSGEAVWFAPDQDYGPKGAYLLRSSRYSRQQRPTVPTYSLVCRARKCSPSAWCVKRTAEVIACTSATS